MQADIIHRTVVAVGVGDADSFRAAGEFFGFVRSRKFGRSSQLCEVWHNETSIVPEENAEADWQTSQGFSTSQEPRLLINPDKRMLAIAYRYRQQLADHFNDLQGISH
jgi:hypothetical protein